MISVDVIKHSEAHLTSKNRSSKNLLSCLEALYTVMGGLGTVWSNGEDRLLIVKIAIMK